jgi:hypothetical protein
MNAIFITARIQRESENYSRKNKLLLEIYRNVTIGGARSIHTPSLLLMKFDLFFRGI